METIQVTPKQALPVVLKRWADLTAEQIGGIASDVWYASAGDDKLTPDADLLAALGLMKYIEAAPDLAALVKLWDAIIGGAEGALFGGLAMGEDSRHFRRVRKFAESLLEPKAMRLLDEGFNALALAASRLSTPEKRATAYLDAADTLAGYEFEVSDTVSARFERWSNRHDSLLRQLADAEGVDV